MAICERCKKESQCNRCLHCGFDMQGHHIKTMEKEIRDASGNKYKEDEILNNLIKREKKRLEEDHAHHTNCPLENKPLSEKEKKDNVQVGISQFGDIQHRLISNFRKADIKQTVKEAYEEIVSNTSNTDLVIIYKIFKDKFGFELE